jgi:hypothetical protein
MRRNLLKYSFMVCFLIFSLSALTNQIVTIIVDDSVLAAPADSIALRTYSCDEDLGSHDKKVCESTNTASLCASTDVCNDCTGNPRYCWNPS